jgi:UPF0716 protein FxsA
VPLLFLAFLVVPLVELYVLIQVGQAIGALPTVAILLADSLLGAALMRSQGRAAWQRFTSASRSARVPAREVVDGALVIFGGALLLTPGFLTDIFGVLLLLPPTRALVRRYLVKGVVARMFGGPAALGGEAAFRAYRSRSRRRAAAGAPGAPGRGADPGDPVDGTATDVDPRRLP